MTQVKVTESLRNQWRNQRTQMIEERTHDQSGRRRSDDDVELVDLEIEVMDYLLALPIGAKFNGMEVYQELAAKRATPLDTYPSE